MKRNINKCLMRFAARERTHALHAQLVYFRIPYRPTQIWPLFQKVVILLGLEGKLQQL